MQKFMAHAGWGDTPGQGADAPRWEPSPGEVARMRATTGQFLAHLIRPTTRYRPDIAALRTMPTRIVVAGGVQSKGHLANRAAGALARPLRTNELDVPVVHGGRPAHPH